MNSVLITDLGDYLEAKVSLYNSPNFISSDPISIPHRFSKKEDIEIAGFLAATIAWGQRPVIIKNATFLLSCMDDSPHEFILNFTKNDLRPFQTFVHRTFNGTDCIYFLKALQYCYKKFGSLEKLFHEQIRMTKTYPENVPRLQYPSYKEAIDGWRNFFFSLHQPGRTKKHFASPIQGSAAKRINMFLRWMIRKDTSGVDFGIWNLSPALLTCPLDVHSGRVARKLGLLKRKQNDWVAAEELTTNLRMINPLDPVRFDFALFGLGIFEKF